MTTKQSVLSFLFVLFLQQIKIAWRSQICKRNLTPSTSSTFRPPKKRKILQEHDVDLDEDENNHYQTSESDSDLEMEEDIPYADTDTGSDKPDTDSDS